MFKKEKKGANNFTKETATERSAQLHVTRGENTDKGMWGSRGSPD